MELLNEIRTGLANLDDRGTMLRLQSLGERFTAWVFREDGRFGVAVAVPDQLCISERFAGARLVTVDRVLAGRPCHLLRLESSSEFLRNEFAVVCAQMVDPGEDGELRQALVSDPGGWWQNWRLLLGNAVVNTTPYSVLGEMLAVAQLLQSGVQVQWNGPAAGSVDIETPVAWYEVKSTLSRYNMRVHIPGQFQLRAPAGRSLFLVHQRFEASDGGVSVDLLASRLVELGAKREWIEKLLAMSDLEPGSSARMETYKLLDSRLFTVDAGFPRITPESFVGGAMPPGIVRFEYVVDLSGLKHSRFCSV